MIQHIKRLSEPKTILFIGVIYTLLITGVFLLPTTKITLINISYLDKLAHVLIHWAFSFIWLWYFFLNDKCHISVKMVFVTLLMCFFYGILIEVSQHCFTATRKFDLYDIVANGIGSLMGLLFFQIVKYKINH